MGEKFLIFVYDPYEVFTIIGGFVSSHDTLALAQNAVQKGKEANIPPFHYHWMIIEIIEFDGNKLKVVHSE